MTYKPATHTFDDLAALASHLRNPNNKQYTLLFAYNGTGKTRLSMCFAGIGRQADPDGDTLYFNAFTEDLFGWDNDLQHGTRRVLRLNTSSRFFDGLEELEMESRIREQLHRYASFNFRINYEEGFVVFERDQMINGTSQTAEHIKISRGEENLFVWCFFLAIARLAIDRQERYTWVKYIYIDDPVSSLDEHNLISMACGLAKIMGEAKNLRFVVSTHHSLFFNVMHHETKKPGSYFLQHHGGERYTLQETGDTPFFHHLAILSELKKVASSGEIYTYHFNALRTILEKTASFFGYKRIDQCIHGVDDEVLFERALNLFSHGRYSIFSPVMMSQDNKDLFRQILNGFLDKYAFEIPIIFDPSNPNA